MVVSSHYPESWARVHVVRGAPPQRLVLRANEPAHLIVGSGNDAHVRIDEPSVAPRQLDVLWDGNALWIEDKLRLGRTFVNGQLLNEWTLVDGDVLVSFGSVRVWLAASSTQPVAAAPDFAALERARTGQQDECDQRRSPTMRLTLTDEMEALLNEAGGP